jgi:hypothetical protein
MRRHGSASRIRMRVQSDLDAGESCLYHFLQEVKLYKPHELKALFQAADDEEKL